MQINSATHYSISKNKVEWESGLLADALAVALLGLLDKDDLKIAKYFMTQGESINCGGTFIKLL